MRRDTIQGLLDEAGATRNRDVLADILRTAFDLATDDADRLDLKITRDALREMRAAYRLFAPYADVRKVTVFGSARTHTSDPLYAQARSLAERLSDCGWMVVTGAGPGIMAAATEGAGPDRSLGVTIRLPFEETTAGPLAGSDRVVSMKYFFTRKLMLVKESSGFVSLPGGFGTLDETLELLTLMQTGKATPEPLVLLDVPGQTYWKGWEAFVADELVAPGWVSPGDVNLFTITDDVDTAVDAIRGFWRNYQSIRWVGDQLVIRLRAQPTPEEVAALDDEFGDLLLGGHIRVTGPLGAEVSDRDALDLPRLALAFDPRKGGRFRDMIDRLNSLPSAPPLDGPDDRVPAA
ncbi:MAG TPA: TIGR00730 family Rossman fold protein [Acidimicrobiales bacterium]|nr:TIGR00730 family Rossman fold protein [Acidimicrobiales bacterium]